MNISNSPEAIENDLVYNIYEAFAFAFENNIEVTIDRKNIPIRSLFEDPSKIKVFLDVILKKENQGPSKREVVDVFQIKKKLRKIRETQEFLSSEAPTKPQPTQDSFVEDSFSLRTA